MLQKIYFSGGVVHYFLVFEIIEPFQRTSLNLSAVELHI